MTVGCALLVAVLGNARAQTRVDLRTQAKSIDFSGVPTKPFQIGAGLPANCSVGEAFFKTGETPGQNLYSCTAANVWTRVGLALPATGGPGQKTLTTDGTNLQWKALSGDVAGAPDALTVQKLQGRTVSGAAPGSNQVLRWNAATQQWEPSTETTAAVSGVFGRSGAVTAQTGDYSASQVTNAVDRTAATSYTPGAKQTFAANGIAAGLRIVPGALPSAPAAGDLAVDASDGNRLKSYDGAQWSHVLTAADGDNYGAVFSSQTSVTIPGADHKLTSLNLLVECYDSGTPPQRIEPDTVAINSATYDITITFSAPQSGRCVVNGSGGGGSGGSGAGGASMGAQLGDFQVTRTSNTVLTVGAGCSFATPCNVRVGGAVYSLTSSASVTLASGTGVLFVYVDAAGTLTAGHTMTLAGVTGLTQRTGVSAFPANAIPIYTWNATNGVWDSNGGTDRRAFLSTKPLGAGTGIAVTEAGQSVISIDTAVVPSYVSGTAALDFPAIAVTACSADLTFTLRGAAPGDAVAAGWPAGLEAGLTGTMRVSATNEIAVRLCNFSGGTVNPAPATFRATIVRSF